MEGLHQPDMQNSHYRSSMNESSHDDDGPPILMVSSYESDSIMVTAPNDGEHEDNFARKLDDLDKQWSSQKDATSTSMDLTLNTTQSLDDDDQHDGHSSDDVHTRLQDLHQEVGAAANLKFADERATTTRAIDHFQSVPESSVLINEEGATGVGPLTDGTCRAPGRCHCSACISYESYDDASIASMESGISTDNNDVVVAIPRDLLSGRRRNRYATTYSLSGRDTRTSQLNVFERLYNDAIEREYWKKLASARSDASTTMSMSAATIGYGGDSVYERLYRNEMRRHRNRINASQSVGGRYSSASSEVSSVDLERKFGQLQRKHTPGSPQSTKNTVFDRLYRNEPRKEKLMDFEFDELPQRRRRSGTSPSSKDDKIDPIYDRLYRNQPRPRGDSQKQHTGSSELERKFRQMQRRKANNNISASRNKKPVPPAFDCLEKRDSKQYKDMHSSSELERKFQELERKKGSNVTSRPSHLMNDQRPRGSDKARPSGHRVNSTAKPARVHEPENDARPDLDQESMESLLDDLLGDEYVGFDEKEDEYVGFDEEEEKGIVCDDACHLMNQGDPNTAGKDDSDCTDCDPPEKEYLSDEKKDAHPSDQLATKKVTHESRTVTSNANDKDNSMDDDDAVNSVLRNIKSIESTFEMTDPTKSEPENDLCETVLHVSSEKGVGEMVDDGDAITSVLGNIESIESAYERAEAIKSEPEEILCETVLCDSSKKGVGETVLQPNTASCEEDPNYLEVKEEHVCIKDDSDQNNVQVKLTEEKVAVDSVNKLPISAVPSDKSEKQLEGTHLQLSITCCDDYPNHLQVQEEVLCLNDDSSKGDLHSTEVAALVDSVNEPISSADQNGKGEKQLKDTDIQPVLASCEEDPRYLELEEKNVCLEDDSSSETVHTKNAEVKVPEDSANKLLINVDQNDDEDSCQQQCYNKTTMKLGKEVREPKNGLDPQGSLGLDTCSASAKAGDVNGQLGLDTCSTNAETEHMNGDGDQKIRVDDPKANRLGNYSNGIGMNSTPINPSSEAVQLEGNKMGGQPSHVDTERLFSDDFPSRNETQGEMKERQTRYTMYTLTEVPDEVNREDHFDAEYDSLQSASNCTSQMNYTNEDWLEEERATLSSTNQAHGDKAVHEIGEVVYTDLFHDAVEEELRQYQDKDPAELELESVDTVKSSKLNYCVNCVGDYVYQELISDHGPERSHEGEEALVSQREEAACHLQAWWRMHSASSRFQDKHISCINIQEWWKSIEAATAYRRSKAIRIQSWWRKTTAEMNYRKTKSSVESLQAVCRGFICRQGLSKKTGQDAVTPVDSSIVQSPQANCQCCCIS